MPTDQRLRALLATFDDEELEALKASIAATLDDKDANVLYQAWQDATLDKRRMLLASKYADACLVAVIERCTVDSDARLRNIAERIAEQEIDKIRSDLVQHLDTPMRKQFEALWDLANYDTRLALLASKYAGTFRKTLLARYIDDLYGGIERAVVATALEEDATSRGLRAARKSSLRWRMVFGVLFSFIGAALVASNLWVLPAMAKRISTNTEHPAAVAIEGLQKYLQESATNEEHQKAFAAITAMAKAVDNITSSFNTLNDNVRSLHTSVPQIDSTAPTNNPSFAALTSAVSEVVPPVNASEREGWTPEKALALFLMANQATLDAQSSGIGVWRLNHNLSDQYLIVPKDATIFDRGAVQKVKNALSALQTHHSIVTDRKTILDQMRGSLTILRPDTGEGLIDEFARQNALIADSGQALRELVITAPKLAESARAATDTLSSVADFVVPYAFAVLAIGAMLVTLGISSVLKSLRLRDDAYDEAVDLNRTLMLGRLAIAFQSHDSKPDALIERLARIGERTRKGEGGVPLPIARALTELVEALKKP